MSILAHSSLTLFYVLIKKIIILARVDDWIQTANLLGHKYNFCQLWLYPKCCWQLYLSLKKKSLIPFEITKFPRCLYFFIYVGNFSQ